MLEELKRVNYLSQDTAAFSIASIFGAEFTYINDAGNTAIDKKVLEEFRKISSSAVVWERGTRLWRWREDYDTASRQAD